ncbi:MAG: right-handed parallel beta-helix repeat-containing protein [Candidatus Auribacterota bacterium]
MRQLIGIFSAAILFFISGISFAQTTYYVAVTGNDSTGDGSSGNPWKTVARGISGMSGGDTLVIREGEYDIQSGLSISSSKNGTVLNPTVIIGEGNVVLLFTGGYFYLAGASYVQIKNMTMISFYSVGIYLNGCQSCLIDGVTVGSGGWNTVYSHQFFGIYLANTQQTTISGCNASYLNGKNYSVYGIYLEGSSQNTISGNTCSYNRIYHSGSRVTGIYLNNNSNTNTVSGNVCEGNMQSGSESITGIGILIENSDGNTFIENRLINNRTSGIQCQDRSGTHTFVRNIFDNNDCILKNLGSVSVKNSIFIDSTLIVQGAAFSSVAVDHCVFSGTEQPVSITAPVSNLSVTNSIFYAESPKQRAVSMDSTPAAYTVSNDCFNDQFAAVSSFDNDTTTHFFHVDPQFRDRARGNVQVLSGSACIGSASDGSDMGVFGGAQNFVDTDNDGLPDTWEQQYSDISLLSDTGDPDFDSLITFDEYFNGANPALADTDNDGIDDAAELLNNLKPWLPDTDADGLNDYAELFVLPSSPTNSDSDSDHISDYFEIVYFGTNPMSTDTDGDGLGDNEEILQYGTSPLSADTDGDGLDDDIELNVENTDPTNPDTDGDLINDADEVLVYHTDPRDYDSDDDWLEDGQELFESMTDPLDNDSDGNAVSDWSDFYDFQTEVQIGSTNVLGFTPVTAYSAGRYVAAWARGTSFVNIKNVDGIILDNDGIASVTISLSTTSTLYAIDVAAANDTFCLAWSNGGIACQIFTPTGLLYGSPVSISNQAGSPSLASNGDDYLICWQGTDAQYAGVFASVIDNDGTKIASSFQVNKYTLHNQRTPDVNSDGDTYMAVWGSSSQELSGSDDEGIYGNTIATSPSVVVQSTSDIHINTYTTGYQSSPAVISNGTNYLVTWQGPGDDGFGLYGRMADAAGTPFGDEILINGFDPGTGTLSAVTGTGIGGWFFVVWAAEEYTSGTGQDIYGRLLDNDGTPVGSAFRINTFVRNEQQAPAAESNGSDLFVVWQGSGQGAAQQTIYGIYFDDVLGDTDNDGLINLLEWSHKLNASDNDYDNDGLDDGYEVLACYTDPKVPDTDKDLQSDFFEVVAGTSPLDPMSLFMFNVSTDSSGLVTLAWPSAEGRVYYIDAADYCTGTYIPAAEVPALAVPGMIEYTDAGFDLDNDGSIGALDFAPPDDPQVRRRFYNLRIQWDIK